MAKEKAKHDGLLCFLLALIVVLILVIGGGAYYFLVVDNGEEIAEKPEILEEISEQNENLKGTTYKGVTIPNGFKVSNKKGEDIVEKGLVVIDSNGNEFVWIPVEDINEMIMCQGHTEKSDCNIVKQNDKLICKIHNELLCGKLYNTYDLEEKEPAVAKSDAQNYNKISNIESLADFENTIQKKFDEMALSVYNNKGFYIGRYEMGDSINNISKKGTNPISASDDKAQAWYGLYSIAESYENSSVQSQMIWGCQYDKVVRWLEKSGYNINDSTSWGNYENVAFEYESNDGKKHIKYGRIEDKEDKEDKEHIGYVKYNIIDNNGNIMYYTISNEEEAKYYKPDGTLIDRSEVAKYKGGYIKIPTGSSEHNKANNIYDLAGNMSEWTQEAIQGCRSVRGGCFGNGLPVVHRHVGEPTSGYDSKTFDNYGTRITLYLK